MAAAFAELMQRLGYDRYGVVVTDWGSSIAPEIGRAAPDNVVGVHVQQVWSAPVVRGRTTVPLGLAGSAADWNSIRTLADHDHANIVSWTVYDTGGHWAAHQTPDLYVKDVRAFFGQLTN